MNNLKRRSGLLAVLCVLLCLALLVCSCKKDPENPDDVTTEPEVETTEPVVETTEPAPETTEPAPETTEPTPETTEPAPETATYTVTVKDGAGAAVAGVQVQLCEGDACQLPMTTDTEGKASGEFPVAVYQVSVVKVPEGYELPEGKVDMGADNTVTVTLKKAVVDEEEVKGTGTATDPFVLSAPNGFCLEIEDVEVAANGSVYYTFTATSDAYISAAVDNAKTTLAINNVTEGKKGAPLVGAGYIAVYATAGNTYEIVLSATEAVTAMFGVEIEALSDGSKTNPHKIYLDESSSNAVVDFDDIYRVNGVMLKEGETVWVKFVTDSVGVLLDCQTPSARVTVNGTTYQPNAQGVIEGIPANTLVGLTTISTAEVNPSFYINYAVGTAGNPEMLTEDHVTDGVTVTLAAGESYYFEAPMGMLGQGYVAYSAAPVTDNTKVGFYDEMAGEFKQVVPMTFRNYQLVLHNSGKTAATFSFTFETTDEFAGLAYVGDPIQLKDISKAITVPSKIATVAVSDGYDIIYTFTATQAGTYTIKTADDDALNCMDCVFYINNLTDSVYGDADTNTATVDAGDELQFVVHICDDHDASFKVTVSAN